MIWPPELTATVVRMWTVEGKTTSEIKSALNLTRNQVVGKLNRMGLLGRKQAPRHKPKPRKLVLHREPNGWENRTYEPWSLRIRVRQIERERGLPFRALEYRNVAD